MTLLELMKGKIRIINVDETLLMESNFTRKAWRGSAYSVS
jgi:hypothetical protein